MGTITADRRVKVTPGGGYDVDADGTTYYVRFTGPNTLWGIYHGRDMQTVPMQGGPGGFAWQIPSAEEAIAIILGQ